MWGGVGWGGVGRTKEPPFFIRYEREKMGGLVFSPLVLSIIDYSSVYSKLPSVYSKLIAWVITFVKSLTLFFTYQLYKYPNSCTQWMANPLQPLISSSPPSSRSTPRIL